MLLTKMAIYFLSLKANNHEIISNELFEHSIQNDQNIKTNRYAGHSIKGEEHEKNMFDTGGRRVGGI